MWSELYQQRVESLCIAQSSGMLLKAYVFENPKVDGGLEVNKRDQEILYRLRNSEGVLLTPKPKKTKTRSANKGKRRRTDLQRLETNLLSLKRSLAESANSSTKNKIRMRIIELERQIEVARMNKKSGLASQRIRAVSGGLPSLGKRK